MATAFRSAGRNEEALQEYFYCLTLKSDWIAVKLEAQKVHLKCAYLQMVAFVW